MDARKILINELPPYTDQWVVVKEDQDVYDIVKDVISKHKKFTPYYDKIALFFDRESTQEICDDLYTFCKHNIKYQEEDKDDQTTAIPTGILIRGEGDCKHYASFIGGILDGINRATGKKIDWHYRFASYDPFISAPGHVFIIVNIGGQEKAIDPTPGAYNKKPNWIIDRYINKNSMLRSNIGSIGVLPLLAAEVLASEGGGGEEGGIFSGITNIVNDFFASLTVGDKVPNYPIKSQNTYTKIVTQIQGEFPPPTNLAQAREQLARATASAAEMTAKGGDVNITYGMIYTETANNLRNIIAQAEAQGTGVIKTGADGKPLPNTPPNNSNMMFLGALGLGAFILLKPGTKKSSVSGISTTNLVLIAIAGFVLFKGMKGTSAKRADVAASLAAEGLTSIADRMTDQEIEDSWQLIFYYTPKDIQAPEPLATRLRAISVKYNIFT